MSTDAVNDQVADVQAGRSLERRIGGVLLLAILAGYALLAPAFSVPGRWAGIAAAFSGLDPFRPVIRPVWSGVTALIAALPVANIGFAFNLLSAFAGAAACWLLYEIVRRIPFSRSMVSARRDQTERVPRIIAGVSASLFTAASLPMIAFSTRGDYGVFDVFILLLALYPVALYIERPRTGCLYASCALMGLALVEYPAAMMVLPGFVVWWIALLMRKPLPKISPYVLAASLLLTGVVVLAVYAVAYDASRVAALRDIKGPAHVIGEFVRLYFAELTRGVPKVGWLLVIGLTIVPFAAVMLRELDEPMDLFSAIGVYSFRAVLVLIAVVTLFELPGSPAYVIGSQVMLLAPSLLVAVWSGTMIGYQYRMSTIKAAAIRSYRKKGRVYHTGKLLVAVWALVLLGATVRHGLVARVDHLAPVAAFADRVIGNLDGRDYLITDGSLDPSLRLAARKAGTDVNIINVQVGSSPEYGRYYASMFDTPDYQALAMLGPTALLRDWLTREPEAAARTALLASPELVRFPGVELQPGSYFYAVATRAVTFDAVAALEVSRSVWDAWPQPDVSNMEEGDAGWFQSQYVIRWMSRLANDIGFLLDEADQTGLAADAYKQALLFWPGNISALLNQREHARRFDENELERIEVAIKDQVERSPAALNVRYLNIACGLIRNPAAILDRLAASGSSALDEAQIQAIARSISPEDENIRVNMARLYLRGANADESEAIYQSLLETNPENIDALYGMFQVSMFRRDTERAAEYLNRMSALGADEGRLALDRAALKMANDDVEGARAIYMNMVRNPNAPPEAWLGLLNLGIREKDDEVIETAFAALERERFYVPGQFMLGERALLRRQPVAAREYFTRVVAMDPGHEAALTRLLQIGFGLRDVTALRQYSGTLLTLRPDHPYANYMSAFVHIDAGNYALAEAALRRSVAVNEDGAALNELAYVIAKQERLGEALEVARRAVEKAPRNYNAWDTLADIQSKLGRQDEAIKAIEQAVEMSTDGDPHIYVHAAELFAAAGQGPRARDMLSVIDASPLELNEDFKLRRAEVEKTLR